MPENRIFNTIKGYAPILLDEIQNENIDKDGNFQVVVKRGSFIVSIQCNVSKPYLDIVFPSPSTDEKILSIFDDLIKKPEFLFGLTSALTSPMTSYSFTQTEGGRFSGFTVVTRVFHNEEDISLKEIDEGIRSVVSVGALGISFISHILAGKINGENKIVQEISNTPYNGMYG